MNDSGSYVYTATNTTGTDSSIVKLKVFNSLVHITKPNSSVVLYVGQALKISCAVSIGSEPLWLHNGRTLLPHGALIETPDTLLIPSLNKDHVGQFITFSVKLCYLYGWVICYI